MSSRGWHQLNKKHAERTIDAPDLAQKEFGRKIPKSQAEQSEQSGLDTVPEYTKSPESQNEELHEAT